MRFLLDSLREMLSPPLQFRPDQRLLGAQAASDAILTALRLTAAMLLYAAAPTTGVQPCLQGSPVVRHLECNRALPPNGLKTYLASALFYDSWFLSGRGHFSASLPQPALLPLLGPR